MKIFKDGNLMVEGVKVDCFKTDTGCNIMIAKENNYWHLSIAHESRLPTWEEVKQARYDLLSRDKTFAMFLPPPESYVNLHEFCFHLHELTEKEKNNIQKKECFF